MPSTLILLTSIIFLLIIIKFCRKSRRAKLLDKLPGPPGIPILGNTLEYIGMDPEDRLQELLRRDKLYGPIYKIWLGTRAVVNITNAELAEVVLNLKDTRKGYIYKFMEPWLGQGLLTAHGSHWTRSRKLITPTFHFQMLETFLEVFCNSASTLVQVLNEVADSGVGVDIFPQISLAAMDSICETAMGTKINAQKKAGSEYVQAIGQVMRLIFYRYDHIWVHNDFLWKRSEPGKLAMKNTKFVHDFVDKVIEERRQKRVAANNETVTDSLDGFKKKTAFLDLLLEECEKEQDGFTDRRLRDEVNTFMFAGHDTTTAAVFFVMFTLGRHPSIQEEVYQEQLAVLGRSKDKRPSIQDLNEMKLLERVIKETLRMYPMIPFISRTMLSDTQIGQRFAMVEGKAFISHIVRNFKIETIDELKTVINMVQKPARPTRFKLYTRSYQ